MQRFNLLPVNIIQKQRRRRMLMRLSAGQIIIFIVVICSFPVISLLSDAVARRSENLARLISDSRYTKPDQLAEKILELNNSLTTLNDLLSSYPSVFLDSEQLKTAIKIIPAGVELVGFEFVDGNLVFNCQTIDLKLAEEQRQKLNDVGFNASFGTIISNDNVYFYDLNLAMVEKDIT